MAEIRFYHLATRSPDQVLPELVQKALGGGQRVIVRARSDAETERLNQLLWTFNPESFIPHGSAKDGHGPDQPVWLSAGNDNPNKAGIMMLVSGNAVPDDVGAFSMCCDIFDGRDETQLNAARARWKSLKDSEHKLTYWQQTDNGWEQKS